MHSSAVCWMNGRIMAAHEVGVSVFDHGLLYGDGVFEGVRFYDRRPFRLMAHLERLACSARAIALDPPYDNDGLMSAVEQTISAFPERDGYLRIVLTRGAGSIGLDPRACGRPTLFIIADHLCLVSQEAKKPGSRGLVSSSPVPGVCPPMDWVRASRP